MKINKKRIHKLESNLPQSLKGKKLVPAIIIDVSKDKKKLLDIGFTDQLEIGETLLPPVKGSVSRFNSEGKSIPDKSKSKVTTYYDVEWTRREWADRGQTREVSSIVSIPREVWRKDFIAPPSTQLTISKKDGSQVYIATPSVTFSSKEEASVKHQINLLLELFGSCDILDEKNVPVIKNTVVLNWEILPPGKRPWKEQKKLLKPLFDQIKSKRKRPVIDQRLRDVNGLHPDFTARGTHGYSGYIVFGFTKKNLYVFESAFYGNAIYVFRERWEELSQKTKAEILQKGLHLERIAHNGTRVDITNKLKELLK